MKTACRYLIVVLLLVTGCSKGPTLEPLAAGSVVLAFGDSLTEGRGAPAGQSYPEVLAQMTGLNVVNAGISDEISAEGLARLPSVLDEEQPALLILCHGGNDLLRKLSETTAEENLRQMIALARARNIPVVLIGVPKPAIFLNTTDWYDSIAGDTGVVYVPEVIAEVLGDASLRADAAHPNASGYRQVAQAVHEALVQAGAL